MAVEVNQQTVFFYKDCFVSSQENWTSIHEKSWGEF